MKLIFLDFDGVLNSRKFLKSCSYGENLFDLHDAISCMNIVRGVVIDEIDIKQIDPVKVRLLNEIIAVTDAKVVVSSSWRIGKSVEHLQAILDFHGFVGEVIGKTPLLWDKDKTRGDEIHNWLGDGFDIESFVIIDDDSDMGDLQHRLMHTSFKTGLQPEHVQQAIALLNR